MRFKLTSTNDLYKASSVEKYKAIGFKFKEYQSDDGDFQKIDEDIFIELNDLNQLMDIISMFDRVIVTKDEIEIYDGYRE